MIQEELVTLDQCNYHYDFKHQEWAFHDGYNTQICKIPPNREYLLLELLPGCSPASGLVRAFETEEERGLRIQEMAPEEECWVGELTKNNFRPVKQTAPHIH